MSQSSPVPETLKPCPFCGGTDVGFGRTGQKWQTVACNECGAEGPCTEIDRDLIIKKWNSRFDFSQTPAASPQEVQEACAQVADRAALRCVRERIPGDGTARFIATAIRALIPPADTSTDRLTAAPLDPETPECSICGARVFDPCRTIERAHTCKLPPGTSYSSPDRPDSRPDRGGAS